MKCFGLLVIALVVTVTGRAQKDRFIFIQQSAGQPFYVRMDEKNFSSSAGGHIILTGVGDSVYKLYVGFPGNTTEEQLFSVPVRGTDRGFMLDNHQGDWTLTDLQTREALKGSGQEAHETATGGTRKTDGYSVLMAGVVNDTAVLYAPAAAKSAAKTDSNKVAITPVAKQGADSVLGKMPRPKDTTLVKSDTLRTVATADSSEKKSLAEVKPEKDTNDVKPVKDTTIARIDTAMASQNTKVENQPGTKDSTERRADQPVAPKQRADSIVVIRQDSVQVKSAALVSAKKAANDSMARQTAAMSKKDSLVRKKDTIPMERKAIVEDSVANPFAAALSARRDSLQRQRDAVVPTKKPQPDPVVQPVIKPKETIPKKEATTPVAVSAEPANREEKPGEPKIIRLETQNVWEGKKLIYVDKTGAVPDTIRIFIPK